MHYFNFLSTHLWLIIWILHLISSYALIRWLIYRSLSYSSVWGRFFITIFTHVILLKHRRSHFCSRARLRLIRTMLAPETLLIPASQLLQTFLLMKGVLTRKWVIIDWNIATSWLLITPIIMSVYVAFRRRMFVHSICSHLQRILRLGFHLWI